MKIPKNSKEKKGNVKLKQIPKSKKEHVLIVAQEIKFARLLSSNEKKTRDRVLKNLKKWLLNCFEKNYEFKEEDFVRVWKGIFYAVWMSDKPLIQEELCDNIAGILDIFPVDKLKYAILMTKAGFKMLATEWYGIDHHRMDKFLMLVRRYLRGSFRVLLHSKWTLKSCEMYSEMLSTGDGIFSLQTPHYARNALSMQLHILDCYLEELSKVSDGDIPPDSVAELLRPFCSYVCGGQVPTLCAAARRLLTALLRQSDQGLQYQQRTLAWNQMGCPEGGPDALELVSDDEAQDDGENDVENEDEPAERPLDPRAGRVDVALATLPVPAELLAQQLREMLPRTTSKAHRRVKMCIERFEQLSRQEYPLKVQPLSPPPEETARLPRHSARALHALEKRLVAASDELALRGLSRKHRKRLLAKSRAGQSIVEDLQQSGEDSASAANGEWQIEPAEPAAKKRKQDTSNKENMNKKRKRDKTDSKASKTRKMNGDATNKRQKLDKITEIPKENTSRKNRGTENGVKESSKKTNECSGKINENKLQNVTNNTKKKLSENNKNNKSVKTLNTLVNKSNKISKRAIEDNEKVILKSDSIKLDSNFRKTNKASNILVNNSNKISKRAIEDNEKVILKSDSIKLDSSNFRKANKTSNVLVNKRDKRQERDSRNKPTILNNSSKKYDTNFKAVRENNSKPKLVVNKVKHFQKQNASIHTPKKVKFVLKNNSMQGPVDYYKSVKQSPNIPYDGDKKPNKTNLKPSTPSPINPFLKKKLKLK